MNDHFLYLGFWRATKTGSAGSHAGTVTEVSKTGSAGSHAGARFPADTDKDPVLAGCESKARIKATKSY